MIKDYELLRNIKLIFTKKIIIWGSGEKGKELLEKLKTSVKEIEFVDSDERKTGTYRGIPIYTPQKVKEYIPEEIAVVISPDHVDVQKAILAQIELLDCWNVDIYTRFAVEAVLCFIKNSRDKIARGGGTKRFIN